MKIIGYKLVKPKYGEAAMKIAVGTSLDKWDSNLKNEGCMFTFDSDNKKVLELAGVLDLWFEPVYETPQIPKGSDAEKFVDFIDDKEIIEIKRECSTLIVKIITKKIDFYFDTETGKYLNIGKYI